jgi:putative oxidoreductase
VRERLAAVAYTLMRIVFGTMFMTYGWMKLGLLGAPRVPIDSLLGAAAIFETIAGPLIAIGWWTRPLAFLASGEMAYAYFRSHQPRGLLPVQNQGIPAVLFCFAFLYISLRGAGIWSVDGKR